MKIEGNRGQRTNGRRLLGKIWLGIRMGEGEIYE